MVRIMGRVRVRVLLKQRALDFELGLNWPEVAISVSFSVLTTFFEFIRKRFDVSRIPSIVLVVLLRVWESIYSGVRLGIKILVIPLVYLSSVPCHRCWMPL